MDEAARRKHCNLLMVEIAPPDPKTVGQQMSLMIDHTTSLSCMQSNENFLLTSFVEPMRVSLTSNTRRSNDKHLSKPKSSLSSAPIIVDETNAQQLQSESQAQKTPRPPNAFILYRRAKQPGVIKKRGHTSNAKLSQILAEMWKNESEEIKYQWKKVADRKKMEHSLKYPGYVYRPKKPSDVPKKTKRNKEKKSSTSNFEKSVFVINPNDDANNEPSHVSNPENNSYVTSTPNAYESSFMVHNCGDEQKFQSYLEMNWEMAQDNYFYNPRSVQYIQQPFFHPSMQVQHFQNEEFREGSMIPYNPLSYDYQQPWELLDDQASTSPFLVTNLDPIPFPTDPIIQANLHQ